MPTLESSGDVSTSRRWRLDGPSIPLAYFVERFRGSASRRSNGAANSKIAGSPAGRQLKAVLVRRGPAGDGTVARSSMTLNRDA